MNPKDYDKSILYIGAAGFEDRALAFLSKAEAEGLAFNCCLAIEYKPFDLRNRKEEFSAKAHKIFDTVIWEVYDRPNPNNFTEKLDTIRQLANSASMVIVDISAMSKMLIVILLDGLKRLDRPIDLIYAEAEIYHPTKDEFDARAVHPDESPIFLTSDVYKVVTVTSLSSVSMQGAPLAMIAFPNFNYLELAALLNEMNSQQLILITGTSKRPDDSWKVPAIRSLNKNLKAYLDAAWEQTGVLDLTSNLELLEKVYNDFSQTHKVVVSPTGGKVQAVACFMLKCMHPDVHIVYPVVKEFAGDYTDGYLEPVKFVFENFQKVVKELNNYRSEKLLIMREQAEARLQTMNQ